MRALSGESKFFDPMVVTLSGIVTLVRALAAKAASANGGYAVWNNHAGEGVVGESTIPNGRNAVWNNHAGEGVVGESHTQWS